MFLKNTLRLSFSNASNIWKLLLYRILCLLCVLGLTTVVAWPIINVLIKDNFFVNLQNSFEQILFNLNPEKLFLTIDGVFKDLANIVTANGLVVQSILCVVFVFVLVSFLECLSKMAITQNVYGYMSSLTKYGFTNSYVSGFGRATLMALARFVTVLPLNVVIWLGTYLLASTLYGSIGVFAVVIAFLLLVVLLSLKYALLCGWMPAYVVHGTSVFRSLKTGFLATIRQFLKILSSFLILTICLLVINIFFVVFTAGVGILVSLPASTLMIIILQNVSYFECMGMRYYTDSNHIASPKRLEERDSFKKLKDII